MGESETAIGKEAKSRGWMKVQGCEEEGEGHSRSAPSGEQRPDCS